MPFGKTYKNRGMPLIWRKRGCRDCPLRASLVIGPFSRFSVCFRLLASLIVIPLIGSLSPAPAKSRYASNTKTGNRVNMMVTSAAETEKDHAPPPLRACARVKETEVEDETLPTTDVVARRIPKKRALVLASKSQPPPFVYLTRRQGTRFRSRGLH